MPDDAGYQPKLLEAALGEFQRQWTLALEQAEELAATYARLLEAQEGLAHFGTRTAVTMPTVIAQSWWVAFRRHQRGETPDTDPLTVPLMRHENEIVSDRLELVEDIH